MNSTCAYWSVQIFQFDLTSAFEQILFISDVPNQYLDGTWLLVTTLFSMHAILV